MNRTILVVDDKARLRTMVKDYLEAQGYRVLTAESGGKALWVARNDKPDLILLDIMMSEMDGYEFIRAYRKEASTPVIMVTAKIEETDKVVGLELGADDYITKPFGMAELVARIRAVLRRSEAQPGDPELLRVREIVLDKGGHTVRAGGKLIDLTPSEFTMLAVLMAQPGHVFSRAELLAKVQGDMYEGVERTVDVHIRNLRTKLESDPSDPIYIQTVFGVGYRFAPDEG
jgi:two-component system, OmpR family, alkaline phosphatase synthesis response regulator PhoP